MFSLSAEVWPRADERDRVWVKNNNNNNNSNSNNNNSSNDINRKTSLRRLYPYYYSKQPRWRWSLWLRIEYNSLWTLSKYYDKKASQCTAWCTRYVLMLNCRGHPLSVEWKFWSMIHFPWQFVNFYPRTCTYGSSFMASSFIRTVWVCLSLARTAPYVYLLFLAFLCGLLTFVDIHIYLPSGAKTTYADVNNDVSWTLYCSRKRCLWYGHMTNERVRYQCCHLYSLIWECLSR